MGWRSVLAAAGLVFSSTVGGWQASPFIGQCDSLDSVPMLQHVTYGQIQAIFNTRCANCHVDHAGNPQSDLDLDPGVSWFYLVDQISSQDPSQIRVVPGSPDTSLLFHKVNCDVQDIGVRMPRLRIPIPLAEQALIYDWILAGAPEVQDDTLFRGRFEPRG